MTGILHFKKNGNFRIDFPVAVVIITDLFQAYFPIVVSLNRQFPVDLSVDKLFCFQKTHGKAPYRDRPADSHVYD